MEEEDVGMMDDDPEGVGGGLSNGWEVDEDGSMG